MRRLSGIVVHGVAAVLICFLTFACNSDYDKGVDDKNTVYLELAEVTFVGDNYSEDGYFEMIWDTSDVKLNVVRNLRADYEIEEGQRVFCNFIKIKEYFDEELWVRTWDIQVNDFNDLVTGKVYATSELSENLNLDELLGSDGMYVNRCWTSFTGESSVWLNIQYTYMFNDAEIEHSVGVVWNDMSEDGKKQFMLRHNANGDTSPTDSNNNMLFTGIASYDISEIVEKHGSDDIYIYWKEYDTQTGELEECSELVTPPKR